MEKNDQISPEMLSFKCGWLTTFQPCNKWNAICNTGRTCQPYLTWREGKGGSLICFSVVLEQDVWNFTCQIHKGQLCTAIVSALWQLKSWFVLDCFFYFKKIWWIIWNTNFLAHAMFTIRLHFCNPADFVKTLRSLAPWCAITHSTLSSAVLTFSVYSIRRE